jgi:hypothetical protein
MQIKIYDQIFNNFDEAINFLLDNDIIRQFSSCNMCHNTEKMEIRNNNNIIYR